MKTIRIRVQHLNNQDIIARHLVDEIPENIVPKLVTFNMLGSNIVEVTIKGYHTGSWHGKVETSFPINLYELENKIGKFIIIEGDDDEANSRREIVRGFCEKNRFLPEYVLTNFVDNTDLYDITGYKGDRKDLRLLAIDMITDNGEIDWDSDLVKSLLFLLGEGRLNDMLREIKKK